MVKEDIRVTYVGNDGKEKGQGNYMFAGLDHDGDKWMILLTENNESTRPVRFFGKDGVEWFSNHDDMKGDKYFFYVYNDKSGKKLKPNEVQKMFANNAKGGFTNSVQFKGRSYKVKVGPKGGQYINVNGKKRYC